MITITEKSIKFDKPVIIDGNSYSEFEWDKARLIPAMDIAIAERFAKEQLFRQNGYVRVRLDGKPANKLDQGTDAYEDYVYADIAFPDYRFWPTEKAIIDNSEEEICGSKTKVGLAISQIYNREKFSTVQERVTKDVALRAKTIAEFGTAKVTPHATQATITQEDIKAKKAKLSPIIQQDPQQVVVESTTTEQAADNSKSEKKQTPVSHYEYVEQDRVNAEPWKSNPVLVQIASKLETDTIKINALIDKVGMIWIAVFEKDGNTFKYNESKSFVLDLNGLIINKDPKVFMLRSFVKYADGCRFQTVREGTLEAIIKDGKLPKIAKDRLEKIDYLIVLNKAVDLASVMNAPIDDAVKERIALDIHKRSSEFGELFNMNGRIRMRFKSLNEDGSYTLMIDPESRNGIYANPIGPSCPAVNYICTPGKEILAQMALPAA